MTRFQPLPVFSLITRPFCCLFFVLAMMSQFVASASASEPIVVESPYSRPLPPGQSTGVVYLSIRNEGKGPFMLTSVSSPRAQKAEFHRHTHENGMMKMRKIDEIELEVGKTLRFEPGGYHIMLFGVKGSWQVGQSIALTITTSSGVAIPFIAVVKAY